MYKDISYGTEPTFSVLATCARGVRTIPMFPTITGVLKNAGFDLEKRRFRSIGEDMWLMIYDKCGTDAEISWMKLFHFFLHAVKMTDVALYPTRTTRVDPSVTLEEVEHDMLGQRLIGFDPTEFARFREGKENETIDFTMLLAGFSAYATFVQAQVELDTHYRARIQKYLQHLLFKFTYYLPTDAFDQTLFQHAFMSQLYNKFGDGTDTTVLSPVESSDALVLSINDTLRAMYQAGPKFKWVPMFSTASRDFNISFIHPYTSKLVVSIGYAVQKGPLWKMMVKPIETFDWTVESQFEGIAAQMAPTINRSTWSSAGLNLVGEMPEINDTGADECRAVGAKLLRTADGTELHPSEPFGKGCNVPTVLDLPEIKVVFRNGKPVYEYFSDALGVIVTAEEQVSVLLDLRRQHKSIGGSAPIKSSMDDTTPSWFFYAEVQNRVRDVDADNSGKLIATFKRQGQIEHKEINMASYLAQHGPLLVRPAFGEYVRWPLSVLTRPAPDAVSWMVAILGLGRVDAMTSQMSLTICYNFWKLKYFLGSHPIVPGPAATPQENLNAYAAKLTFGAV